VKLQVKVILLVVVILLVIGVISSGTMLYFQRRASINQFEHMALALAGAVQCSLEHSMLTSQCESTQEAIIHISEEEIVSAIGLFSPAGLVIASSETSDIGRVTDSGEIRETLQTGKASILTGTQNGQGGLRVITPIINKPECQSCHVPETSVLGAIQISLNTTLLDTQTRQQTLFIAGLGVFTFLIIVTGLALGMQRAILKPISKLALSAHRLSRGDYAARAESGKNDEIGLLAQTFNEIAEHVEQRTRELEASRHELAEWNVGLENKIQQRTKELSALNAVITTISQSLKLDKILNDALAKILSVMDVEGGMIHLPDEKGAHLMLVAQQGLSADYVRQINKLHPGENIAGRVYQSVEPIVVNDILDNNDTISIEGKKGKFRAYISLPIKSKNKISGTLSLASYTPNKFEPEAEHLLSAMADAIGIALENAQAAKRLEEANEIREQLLKKLISAQEEERRRIARELHDEASQSLAALALSLEDIANSLPARYHDARQKLDVLKERAIQTLGGIRNLALELRPSALDDLGLITAIDWYVKDYLAKRGLDVKIEITGPKTKLPSYTETMLFRIIQEALTNVVKHAEASQVKVKLQLSDLMGVVQIEDNGKGFDVEAAISGEGGRQNLGLHGMAERTTLLGGTFNITSQPGRGTCLHVEVPLAKEIAPDE